jgi:hypothetical protein
MSRKKNKQKKFKIERLSKSFTVIQEPWDRQPRRLEEGAISFFEEMSPGFRKWYKANYDESGKYVGKKVKDLNE